MHTARTGHNHKCMSSNQKVSFFCANTTLCGPKITDKYNVISALSHKNERYNYNIIMSASTYIPSLRFIDA